MAFSTKKWEDLYNSTTTTNVSDIVDYNESFFSNLPMLGTYYADSDADLVTYFQTNFANSNAGFLTQSKIVQSSYFKIKQFSDPTTKTPNITPTRVETPFSYILSKGYKDISFYNQNLFGIKTTIESFIDTELSGINAADINLFKTTLIEELITTRGYSKILFDHFGKLRTSPPSKSATVEELLKIYARTLKSEGYDLTNFAATSNSPTAKAAKEILQGGSASVARATVTRSISDTEPRKYAEGDLQRFLQCALMSDLFLGPSGLDNIQNSYANQVKTQNGYSQRIYPVGFKIDGSREPGNFMNKLLYPSGTQDFFQNTLELYPSDNAGWYVGDDKNQKHQVITKSIHFVEKVTTNKGKTYLNEVEFTNIENLATTGDAPTTSISAGNILQLQSILNSARAVGSARANTIVQSRTGNEATNIADLESKIQKLYSDPTASAVADATASTTEDIIFDGMTITFNGTNPSTARKDVTVEIKFTLSSLEALTSKSIGKRFNGNDLFLKDLVTIADSDSGSSPILKNNYAPDSNRIRVKAAARKTAAKDSTSHLPGCDLILDLSVIDHSLERNAEGGTVNFTVNYRGFFSSALSMPFMDCLVDSAVVDNRIKRSKDFDNLVKHFTNKTIPAPYPNVGSFAPKDPRKAPVEEDVRNYLKESRKQFENESSVNSDTFIKRLVDAKKIKEYTLNKANLFKTFVNDGFFDYKQGLTSNTYVTVSSTASAATDANIIKTLNDIKKEDEDKKETSSRTTGYFFYFGDLIKVVTDSIYDTSSPGQLKSEFSHLKLKFLISDIQIYNPIYSIKKTINICQIPIDLSFFAQWYNDVVTSKSLKYFPINQMIISLSERLIGNLLYEMCYGDTFPNERPPRLRVGFFTDTRTSNNDKLKQALNAVDNGTEFSVQFDAGSFNGEPLILRDANFVMDENNQPNTYCIIYMQSPPFLLPMESGKVTSYRLKSITPQINYGKKGFTSYNYLSNVSFTKTDQPFLREARYFNNRALSMISNVYDLSFSFKEIGEKASTVLYPATTIELFLRDWTKATDWFPHYKNSIAGLLGFGGYFGISSVTYSLGVTDSIWSIDVKTKFLGTDSSAIAPTNGAQPTNLTNPSSASTEQPQGSLVIPGENGGGSTPSGAVSGNGGSVSVGGQEAEESEETPGGEVEVPNAEQTPDAESSYETKPDGAPWIVENQSFLFNGYTYELNSSNSKYEQVKP